MSRAKHEEGQSIILVVLAMGIFLIGAVGLGFDGSHLYSERMRAQLAADAAAQAGILSIFDGTNSIATNSAKFPVTSFTCADYPSSTPCKYAGYHGFSTSDDTVSVSFPASAPGVSLSSTDPTNLIHVEIDRNVSTTLMRLLGPTFTTVKAVATAAIVSVSEPIPILVTHPTLTNAFQVGGNGLVKICGGPSRSIQVNSGAGAFPTDPGTAFAPPGNGGGSTVIDLSHAGPNDDGFCHTGTGADMGVWGTGNSSSIANVSTGSADYLPKASPIDDPLADVPAPPNPGSPGTQTPNIPAGTGQCPASAGSHGCTLLTPGEFQTGIILDNTTALITPGVYYIDGSQSVSGVQYGLSCASGCNMQMLTGTTTTDTGAGALFYLTGTVTTTVDKNGKVTTNSSYGGLNISSNGSVSLLGTPDTSKYEGMLFFEDRSAPALTDNLGGGGTMVLQGTIYLTNDLATMESTPSQYQALTLGGNAGNNTTIEGEIITGQLILQGTPNITMDLDANRKVITRKVALVE